MTDIVLKSREEIARIGRAGAIAAEALFLLAKEAAPGTSTLALDRLAEEIIRSHDGAEPAFLDHEGHPGSIYTCVNEEIVEGHEAECAKPNARPLKEGDVVLLDIGVSYEGFNCDTAITVPVGEISQDKRRLLNVAEEALYKGIAVACSTSATLGISVCER